MLRSFQTLITLYHLIIIEGTFSLDQVVVIFWFYSLGSTLEFDENQRKK